MLPLLQRLSQAFLHAVFPPKCLICGVYDDSRQAPVGSEDSYPRSNATAPYFCESCRKGFTQIASPFCSTCGLPFVSREGDNHTCSECLLEEKHFRKARAFGTYAGSLMEAIHLFKYGKKTSLSRPLGVLVRETFFQFWNMDTVDLMVSVPLHGKRIRERGFNQAHLLIRRWAKKEGIPIDGFMLSRTGWTRPQTTLSRTERQKNIKGAFSLRPSHGIEGRRILLVDDVYTTGATVNECARVLMKGGAECVDVLTLARTV